MKNLVLGLAFATIAAPVAANSLGPFDDLLVFGDSLSDPGNAYTAYGDAAAPSDFYPTGAFTDGLNWADLLGATFESGTNFAFGGAKAATDPVDDGAPDFAAQRTSYFNALAGSLELGDNPLTAVFFGGNDMRQATNEAEAVAIAGAAITSIVTGVLELAGSGTGLDDFIVFGLPNLARLPAIALTETTEDDTAAFAATLGFNTGLKDALDSIAGLANIIYFDTFAYAPLCGPENVDIFPSLVGDDPKTGFVFYDFLHPTGRIHDALAAAVTDAVTPVPLPAGAPLLLFALGALGVASRRRVAVRTH